MKIKFLIFTFLKHACANKDISNFYNSPSYWFNLSNDYVLTMPITWMALLSIYWWPFRKFWFVFLNQNLQLLEFVFSQFFAHNISSSVSLFATQYILFWMKKITTHVNLYKMDARAQFNMNGWEKVELVSLSLSLSLSLSFLDRKSVV